MKKRKGSAFLGGAVLVLILGWFGFGPGLGGGNGGVLDQTPQSQQEPQQEQQEQQGNTETVAIVVSGEQISVNGEAMDIEGLRSAVAQLPAGVPVTLEDSQAVKAVFEEAEAVLQDAGISYTLQEAQ